MHVAMILMSGNPQMAGGVPAAVMSRARYLMGQGIEVSVICRGVPGFDRPTEVEGVRVIPVRVRSYRVARYFERQWFHPWLPYSQMLALFRLHRRHPVDLVDMHDGQTALGVRPFVRLRRVPAAFTVHGTVFANPDLPPLFRRYMGRAELVALRTAQRYLPVSGEMRDVHQRLGFPADRFTVVPNAVGEDALAVGRRVDLDARAQGPLRLLFAGRIVREKRLDVALRALAAVKNDSAAALRVLGDGPERGACQRLAQELGIEGRVSFSEGFVRDRGEVLRAFEEANVFLFPSSHEPFGIALVEAMAAGLCAVTSDTPTMRDILGGVGLMFPVDDVETLAGHLRTLERDRERLRRQSYASRERARAFEAEVCYRETLRVYREALAGTD